MSAFQFSITHKLGITNTDADALSRLPQILSVESVQSTCDSDQGHPLIETLHVQPSTCQAQNRTLFFEPSDHVELHDLQQKDAWISKWIHYGPHL